MSEPKMLTPKERALLQRHVAINGDGNVVGNDNTVQVTKVKTDTYTVQKDQRQVTFTVQDLRQIHVQGSQVAGVGDNWHVKGGIHYNISQTASSDAPKHPRVYHNLPQPDYGEFVGRKEELAQVHRILRPYPHSRHAVVTIDGIGGIGKSALALEIAHRYLRDYERLPEEERFDAIIWTSAKASVLTADGIAPRQQITRTLEDIYTAIAVTLEREAITRTRPEEQDAVVTKALTRQRTLLIVDNLETVDDERVNAFLRELPAPTKAIVTTRHRIDVAYPIRLTGMPEEDALILIARECKKKGVQLADEESERLFQRTGGVPLAMVWSIAQMGYGYGVNSTLRRLGKPCGDIVLFCFRELIEKILDTDAYKMLMTCSLFPTSADRKALGYIAEFGEDLLSRDESLVSLENLSLVYHKGNRFFMSPLVRMYAQSRVAPQVLHDLRARYVEWSESVLDEWHKSPYRSMGQFELECKNILEALDWEISSSGNINKALSLIEKAQWLLFLSGRWDSLIVYTTRVLEGLVEIGQLQGQPMLRSRLGGVFYFQGKHAESIRAKSHALQIAEELDDSRLIADISSSFSEICEELGDSTKADQLMHIAFNASLQIDNSVTRAAVKRRLGRVYLLRDEYGLAEKSTREALSILKQCDSAPEVIASAEWWIGVIMLKKGNLAKARMYLTQSLAILEQSPTANLNIGGAKKWMAILEEKEQNYEEALVHAKQALDVFSRLNMQGDIKAVSEFIERIDTRQHSAQRRKES